MSKPINKLAYRPVGLVLGMAAGALAGAIFHQVWKIAAGHDEVPSAIDEERGWGRSWPPRPCRARSSRPSVPRWTGVVRPGYGGSPATGRHDCLDGDRMINLTSSTVVGGWRDRGLFRSATAA